MPESVMEAATKPTLHAAVSALALRNADWASEQNGVGFNKSDSWFGAALAGVPEDSWTDEMRYSAWAMLRKYKKQLLNYGIDYDAIPVPPKPEGRDDIGVRHEARSQVWNKRGAEKAKDEGKIEKADGGFLVSFPYDAATVDKVKEIPGRTFDGRTKQWFVPETEDAIAELAKFSRVTGIEPDDPEVAEWLSAFAANYVEKPKKRIERGEKDGDVILISPYNEDQVTALRAAGGKWDKDRKVWRATLGASASALQEFAKRYGFHVEPDLADEMQDAATTAVLRHEQSSAMDADIEVKGLGAILRPFQKAGVRYLTAVKAAILGDEQGLGKTPQALASAQKLEAFPFICVVPNLAKRNWLRETDFWLPERSITIIDKRKKMKIKRIRVQKDIVDGWRKALAETKDPAERERIEYALHWDQVRRENPERIVETNNLDAEIIIINYDIIWRKPNGRIAEAFEARFPGQKFDSIVEGLIALRQEAEAETGRETAIAADESHFLKNDKAKRTRAVKALAEATASELIWLLSGTPVRNRPIEFLPQLDIIGRLQALGGWWALARRYCYAGQGYNGKADFSGAQNLQEFNRRLRELCYIRREKKDVMPELPPVQRSTEELPLKDPAHYRRVAADVISWVKKRAAEDANFLAEIADLDAKMQKAAIRDRQSSAAAAAARAEILVRLNALRLVAAQQVLPAQIEWLTEWLENNPDEKIIVFAWHQEIQQGLIKAFPGCARITEDLNDAKRSEQEYRFQEDPEVRMLVAGINVAGVSLTLTAAKTVAHAELPWVPGDIDQAEGRAYGRLSDAHGVTAIYLIGEETIYVDMAELLDAKREVVDEVTSGAKGSSGAGIMASLVSRLLTLDEGLEDSA